MSLFYLFFFQVLYLSRSTFPFFSLSMRSTSLICTPYNDVSFASLFQSHRQLLLLSTFMYLAFNLFANQMLHCNRSRWSLFALKYVYTFYSPFSILSLCFFCFVQQFGFVYLFVVYVVVVRFIHDLLVVIFKQLRHFVHTTHSDYFR